MMFGMIGQLSEGLGRGFFLLTSAFYPHLTSSVYFLRLVLLFSRPYKQLSIQSAFHFSPFQSLRARNLRVHAGSGVVFLAAAENLLLQHQLPRQHSGPCRRFPDGTLQFGARRQNGAQHSLGRRGGILWRDAARSRRRNLPTPAFIPAAGLLFDCGNEADALRDDTPVHGQDCSVRCARAVHPAVKNRSLLGVWNLKKNLGIFFSFTQMVAEIFMYSFIHIDSSMFLIL